MAPRSSSAAIATVLVIAGLSGPSAALSQTYPLRPITVVVPFPAGGPVDTLARVLAEPMRGALNQPLVIENVPGAGGSIGVGRAARAAPDGYTLIIGDWTSHVASGAIYPVRYDLRSDFAPVGLLSTSSQLIIGKAALPALDLKGLIAWLKDHPDTATAATVGIGSNPHLCGVMFQKRTGTSFQFVPYRGGAPAMQAMIAGETDLMCSEASNALAHIRSGRLRAYAVLSNTRWSAAPEIPTVEEAGLPGFHIVQWRGLWAPKATSKDIVAKLNAALVLALGDPAVRQRLADLGQQAAPLDRQRPEALDVHHQAEINRWWPIIKEASIRVE